MTIDDARPCSSSQAIHETVFPLFVLPSIHE
jgi:hypothetical protein